jgi:hypothetical protein
MLSLEGIVNEALRSLDFVPVCDAGPLGSPHAATLVVRCRACGDVHLFCVLGLASVQRQASAIGEGVTHCCQTRGPSFDALFSVTALAGLMRQA